MAGNCGKNAEYPYFPATLSTELQAIPYAEGIAQPRTRIAASAKKYAMRCFIDTHPWRKNFGTSEVETKLCLELASQG
jgi:hypothetical protein